MIKLFLDANILIDVTDTTRASSKMSAEFIEMVFDDMYKYKLFTSCDLITTIYYILRKELGREQSLKEIKKINKFINIIEFGNTETGEAIELMERNKKYTDLEDTIQYIMARKEKCDYIITNDKAFASGDVPVLSSEEALTEFSV